MKMPEMPEIYPIIHPTNTSNGKCAPTPILVVAKIIPIKSIDKYQKILSVAFLGMKLNMITVSIVKTVIEWPEGKLFVWPRSGFPTITKVWWSKIAAGLGTEKMNFKTFESIPEIRDALINDSQSFGAFTIKIDKNDRAMSASPNWVRLYSVNGKVDNLSFK